jgi:hypothetical protein
MKASGWALSSPGAGCCRRRSSSGSGPEEIATPAAPPRRQFVITFVGRPGSLWTEARDPRDGSRRRAYRVTPR